MNKQILQLLGSRIRQFITPVRATVPLPDESDFTLIQLVNNQVVSTNIRIPANRPFYISVPYTNGASAATDLVSLGAGFYQANRAVFSPLAPFLTYPRGKHRIVVPYRVDRIDMFQNSGADWPVYVWQERLTMDPGE